ncbi:MAG: DUF1592 domain-containing protein [Bryobacterales bacterium]|nr:DUF1592 domain-containing protein [Bryobacterales bacterium]
MRLIPVLARPPEMRYAEASVRIQDAALPGGLRGVTRVIAACMLWLGCIHALASGGLAQDLPRVRDGLVALYDFGSLKGELVLDRSGFLEAADTKLDDPDAVRLADGSLTIDRPTRLRSLERVAKIADLVRVSGELTVEAWIEPVAQGEATSAGIVMMSNATSQHNFALVQVGDRFEARFRTSRTGTGEALPIRTPEASARPALTHLAFTRDRSGRARVFLDGEIASEGTIAGSASDWEKTTLVIGNGPQGREPWLGSVYLVAIYGRDLLAEEVARNFRAGPRLVEPVSVKVSASPTLFEDKIAPLLASHCLDCHDSAVRQAGLDLSSRESALAGGDHGNAIVPGAASESLVWLMAESEAMPQNRPPLSAAQKQALREWIDGGAAWSYETIDPALHGRGQNNLPSAVRRLTVSEYAASIRSATGVDLSEEAARLVPPDLRADGFENTAYNLTVDLRHVEAYARLAESTAQRINIKRIAGDGTELTDSHLRRMGERILRGPLSEREIDLYRALAESVRSSGGSFEGAVRHVLEAMLQSPRFLYRIEQQKGDGSRWPTDAHELAARLSYIIWGEPPDTALSAAAAAGTLHDIGELRRQTRRMLADPRAVARSVEFVAQWLDLGRLETLRPDSEQFPQWNPQLAADMRSETIAFFKDLVWDQRRPLGDLLNAQFTYLTPALATHYGLDIQGSGLRRYELAGVPSRGGILTQGAVLTKGGSEASMVTRGLFVLEDLLFGEVGSPPPGTDTTPVPASAGRSRRAIATDRVESPACGGCHARFEPLAFGLERFDGLGGYHDFDEHGNELREDGEILFPGSDEPVAYATAAEMMELLAASDRARRNLTRKVTQFAIGRPLSPTDEPAVDEIHRRSQASGGTYASLIEAIVTSDLVRRTQTEP